MPLFVTLLYIFYGAHKVFSVQRFAFTAAVLSVLPPRWPHCARPGQVTASTNRGDDHNRGGPGHVGRYVLLDSFLLIRIFVDIDTEKLNMCLLHIHLHNQLLNMSNNWKNYIRSWSICCLVDKNWLIWAFHRRNVMVYPGVYWNFFIILLWSILNQLANRNTAVHGELLLLDQLLCVHLMIRANVKTFFTNEWTMQKRVTFSNSTSLYLVIFVFSFWYVSGSENNVKYFHAPITALATFQSRFDGRCWVSVKSTKSWQNWSA